MSRKIQIVLPDPAATQLAELAVGAGERPATLAAQLVRHGLALAAADGKVRSPKQVPMPVASAGAVRPRWLEPYGGDLAWRAELWGAIAALHGRYPQPLAYLKEGWWADEAHTETLCALAIWRADIDDGGVDPREELAFHSQLADYAQVLRRESGGVSTAWTPGAPPDGWARE